MTERTRWVCPHCDHAAFIDGDNRDYGSQKISLTDTRIGTNIGVWYKATSCPNPRCRELSLLVKLVYMRKRTLPNGRESWVSDSSVCNIGSIPGDTPAKPQPEFIPIALVEDYREACDILSRSPKASATLSRRCLQGMIRDFWGVNDQPNLFKEIDAIKERVDPDTWAAIDAVRQVGNIGAHMEQDINLIVEVDESEAALLIQLIEDLFQDWYVVREQRARTKREIIGVAEGKRAARYSETPQEADLTENKDPSD